MSKVDAYQGLSHTNESGAQRPGVMARLHALFPSGAAHEGPPPLPPKPMDSRKARPKPKAIKVRILTWNMHESLPKGELDELLGKVQPSYPSYPLSEDQSLPEFPSDENHPYHLVVVAGQECPTISGLPRGLGAPGFQLKDREKKEKEKQKDKDRDEEADHAPLLHSKSEGGADKGFEGRERPRSLHRLHLHRDHSQKGDRDRDSYSLSNGGTPHEHSHSQYGYGWSSMLEEWYTQTNSSHRTDAYGNDIVSPKPTLLDVPIGDERDHRNEEVVLSPKAQSTGDLNARMNAVSTDRGPYELLIKERMMGLYIAVFVHRDVRALVEGTSKSAVTAGLIGGRLGNKGGVGVSLKVAGTTFLFINAHLAAHEGKMHHRLANLAKIKSELAVNDFLKPDDTRIMSEDLTDKFDYSFIFGDLNFRLDITRLHADWLLSRRDYAQALAFDQLRKTMEAGQAFIGFREAPIDFPPTFKYDVQRSSKRHKLRSIKRLSKTPGTPETAHEKMLTEIEEKEKEEREDEDEEDADAGDAASVTSSAWMSVGSRYTSGEVSEHERGGHQEEDAYFSYTNASTAAATRANVHAGSAMHKVWAAAAAHKAKAKFVALINNGSNSPAGKLMKLKKKAEIAFDESSHSTVTSPPFQTTTVPPTPEQDTPATSPGIEDHKYLKPSRSLASSAGELAKAIVRSGSPRKSEEEENDEDDEKGVYDSSHKKRVPSWCDRILWKSTIVPPPDIPEEEESPAPSAPSRNRFNLFHAFRQSRARRDSQMSVSANSLTSPEASDTEGEPTTQRAHHPSSPLSRQPPRLLNSRSIDALPKLQKPTLDRVHSHQSPIEKPNRSRKSSPPILPMDSFDTSSSTPDTILAPLSTSPDPSTTTAVSDSPPPVPPKDAPNQQPLSSFLRTFNFLSPFHSRDSPRLITSEPELPPREGLPNPPPRRGDVVCLGYHTLDDKGMKRLMGRSDHRPVIGSYALYI